MINEAAIQLITRMETILQAPYHKNPYFKSKGIRDKEITAKIKFIKIKEGIK